MVLNLFRFCLDSRLTQYLFFQAFILALVVSSNAQVQKHSVRRTERL